VKGVGFILLYLFEFGKYDISINITTKKLFCVALNENFKRTFSSSKIITITITNR